VEQKMSFTITVPVMQALSDMSEAEPFRFQQTHLQNIQPYTCI